MDDLVAFLRARLDEDEQVALESIGQTGVMLAGADAASVSVWRVVERQATGTFVTARDQWDRVTEVVPTYGGMYAEHIARHDPARVLREIDAKRQIVKAHGVAVLRAGGGAQHFVTATVCRSCEPNHQFPEQSWPCPTLRLLALPYADHPDHLEDWQP
ncbi:DUF6221 family protein [Streptomyces sp. L-9-10]|uniref:DUF6221 family protein n=1 Tax=Streptomyces sp. L-9-10 TaxID=1478131 RepID=UPI00101DDA71|nr:DUF6221 family protein [Streptomyces sp. L-9-10]